MHWNTCKWGTALCSNGGSTRYCCSSSFRTDQLSSCPWTNRSKHKQTLCKHTRTIANISWCGTPLTAQFLKYQHYWALIHYNSFTFILFFFSQGAPNAAKTIPVRSLHVVHAMSHALSCSDFCMVLHVSKLDQALWCEESQNITHTPTCIRSLLYKIEKSQNMIAIRKS